VWQYERMKKKKTKRKTRKKPQRDVNQMAFDIVNGIVVTDTVAAQTLGRKGGIARKAKLSKAQ
jgi:hypothetical protein